MEERKSLISQNHNKYKRKVLSDQIVNWAFFAVALISASTIIITVIFIFSRGISPFVRNYTVDNNLVRVNFGKFLIGGTWSQGSQDYGVGFIIVNTIYVVLFALIIAVPISVLTALFITRIAPKILGAAISHVVELLASIPSIIYGLFGGGVIVKIVIWLGEKVGYQTAGGQSMLAASLVLAIMILPTITMLSTTAIRAVKQDQILASLALGASPTQTNFKIVLRGAKSGIFSGVILALGRALGEATAVSMVAGNAVSGPNFNPLDITRTLTSTILMELHEMSFGSLDYDIRFSVGLILMLIILVSNIALNYVKNRIMK